MAIVHSNAEKEIFGIPILQNVIIKGDEYVLTYYNCFCGYLSTKKTKGCTIRSYYVEPYILKRHLTCKEEIINTIVDYLGHDICWVILTCLC